MRATTYYRNAVTVTITEEEAYILHAALDMSPAPLAAATQHALAHTLKHMKRFRRRYESRDERLAHPINRELFPTWVS